MLSELDWLQSPCKTPNLNTEHAAKVRQAELTKPAGSLGSLETLAIRLAALQGDAKPKADQVSIAVFAADHGIAAEGVSAFPQAVTAQMVHNFSAGGAAICVLAKSLNAALTVYNLGTVTALPALAQVQPRVIAPQTANFRYEPAMSDLQLAKALAVGREAVLAMPDTDLFVAGEMGIANTTSATAIAAVLTGVSVRELTGPGTGLDDAGVQHKAHIIEGALATHALSASDPLRVLQTLGGFEIAALVGAYLSCAQAGIPAVVDGYICTVAALTACKINPAVEPWLILSHTSAEPGFTALQRCFKHPPLLALGMRLGEGSGAATAIPLIRTACALHNQMATFAEAAVAGRNA